MGLRDTILAADDLACELVEVEDWRCTVGVAALACDQFERWQKRAFPKLDDGTDAPQKTSARAMLLCECLVDPDTRARIFTDADVAALSRKGNASIERLAKIALRLNGIGEDEIDELKKTSDETPNESSGSDSPEVVECL